MYRFFFVALLLSIFISQSAQAQQVTITDSPRHFTAKIPERWVRLPPDSGNSRLKLMSPDGTPLVECSVIVKTMLGFPKVSQAKLNEYLIGEPDIDGMTKNLSVNFNNVRILSASHVTLSNIPAQIFSIQYSIGSPMGTLWTKGTMITTLTVPDVSMTVGCFGIGRTPIEAEKAFDYWQGEIVRFPTFIELRN